MKKPCNFSTNVVGFFATGLRVQAQTSRLRLFAMKQNISPNTIPTLINYLMILPAVH